MRATPANYYFPGIKYTYDKASTTESRSITQHTFMNHTRAKRWQSAAGPFGELTSPSAFPSPIDKRKKEKGDRNAPFAERSDATVHLLLRLRRAVLLMGSRGNDGSHLSMLPPVRSTHTGPSYAWHVQDWGGGVKRHPHRLLDKALAYGEGHLFFFLRFRERLVACGVFAYLGRAFGQSIFSGHIVFRR
jgi:hypothetical protein